MASLMQFTLAIFRLELSPNILWHRLKILPGQQCIGQYDPLRYHRHDRPWQILFLFRIEMLVSLCLRLTVSVQWRGICPAWWGIALEEEVDKKKDEFIILGRKSTKHLVQKKVIILNRFIVLIVLEIYALIDLENIREICHSIFKNIFIKQLGKLYCRINNKIVLKSTA